MMVDCQYSKRSAMKRIHLNIESLEDRSTPAQFGVPWNEPTHLTLSFVPDKTSAVGGQSDLFAKLDAQMPREVWQQAILKGFQSWGEVANINVGLVTDSGAALGASGPVQGDARFGDIRVAGQALTPGNLAVSVPPSAYLSGTYAGDLLINTASSFLPSSLSAVALHEAGHALGLPHSTDPQSVMFSHLNSNTVLAAADIAAIRDLYGNRQPDANEEHNGNADNNVLDRASRIRYSSSEYTGATPLVVYGDITTPSDVDYFWLKPVDDYSGPITFRVQTSGVSLLTPRLTILRENGQVLATGSASGAFGGVVSVTLPTSNSGEKYYARVEAASNATHTIGRYGLAASFGSLLQPTALSVDQVIRGPYENLKPDVIAKLFVDPATALFDDDLHENDDPATATQLEPGQGQFSAKHLQATASLSDGSDVDTYLVRTPQASGNQQWVFTASTRGLGANGVTPSIQILNTNLTVVPATVIVNGNGTYTVQATAALANQDYYVRVAGPSTVGNYALDVTFGTVAAEVGTYSAQTLATASSIARFKLTLTQSQVLSLNLGVTGAAGAVRMDFRNSSGKIVLTLTARVGDVVSGVSELLNPGTYGVTLTPIDTTGPVRFTLRGTSITIPIGAVVEGVTQKPHAVSVAFPDEFAKLGKAGLKWVLIFLS